MFEIPATNIIYTNGHSTYTVPTLKAPGAPYINPRKIKNNPTDVINNIHSKIKGCNEIFFFIRADKHITVKTKAKRTALMGWYTVGTKSIIKKRIYPGKANNVLLANEQLVKLQFNIPH